MVSLSDENRRSGGFYFDAQDLSLQSHESDEVSDGALLGANDDPGFRKISTVPTIIILILLSLCNVAACFILPFLCDDDECGISPYSLILYVHGGLWFLVMLADRYLRVQHFISRTQGYLEFYRKTKNIRRVPFIVYSGGNALLLVLTTVLNDYCTDNHGKCSHLPLSKSNFVQVMVAVETLVVFPLLVTYLVWTVRFNKRKTVPDVHQDDVLAGYVHTHMHTSDVGFRDEEYMDDILEKQADLIRYLKEHNANLGKKILKLTRQLQVKSK